MLYGIVFMEKKMEPDSVSFIGQTLDYVVAHCETNNIPYRIKRMDKTPIRTTQVYVPGMVHLEVDNKIVTKVFVDGMVYEQHRTPEQDPAPAQIRAMTNANSIAG